MLTFNYNEQNVNAPRRKSVSIPLLTLVPLPLLHVEEAEAEDITDRDDVTEGGADERK